MLPLKAGAPTSRLPIAKVVSFVIRASRTLMPPMMFQPGKTCPEVASTPWERCWPVMTEKPVLTGSVAATLLR